MNKLLLFLLLPIISFSQGVGCQDSIACDYDVNAIASSISFNTPVVTGSTMNIGLVTDLDNGLLLSDYYDKDGKYTNIELENIEKIPTIIIGNCISVI